MADWINCRGGEVIERARFLASGQPSPHSLITSELCDEIERLRAWIDAIGSLPDVDADERGWMARNALDGLAAPTKEQ